jgi:hypothetical protein
MSPQQQQGAGGLGVVGHACVRCTSRQLRVRAVCWVGCV